jgi:hypothetical protein
LFTGSDKPSLKVGFLTIWWHLLNVFKNHWARDKTCVKAQNTNCRFKYLPIMTPEVGWGHNRHLKNIGNMVINNSSQEYNSHFISHILDTEATSGSLVSSLFIS